MVCYVDLVIHGNAYDARAYKNNKNVDDILI